jgi:hypothetical protein
LDFEDCEEPNLVETDEENSDNDAECLFCSGLFIRTDGTKIGLKSHNTTNGAVKSVQVQTTGTTFFVFFCNNN